MNAPLSWWENLLFFMGKPKTAPDWARCCKCRSTERVIDLGDGDFICEPCWDAHIPDSYP